MAIQTIVAKKEVDGNAKMCQIEYDFGANVDESIQKFGAEVVFSNFKKSAVITVQAAMRRLLETGKSQEEVTSALSSWKPGIALERVSDPTAALVARFPTMTPQEQADVLQKLKEAAKAAK